MTAQLPSRGEIWLVDLNPNRRHEQSGVRPALVVLVDTFNHGPAGLAGFAVIWQEQLTS